MAVHEDKRRVKWLRGSVADRVKIDGRPSIGSLNQHWLHMRQNATGRATYPQYYRAMHCCILCIRILVHRVIRITTEVFLVGNSFLLHYTVLSFYFYSNPYLTNDHFYV